MPYSINLNRSTISLNQHTQLIIDLFQKSCQQLCKTEAIEDKLCTDLSISEQQLRKGFVPRLLNKLENFNEKKYGASFATLCAIDHIKLDPKAHKMLTAFTNEINNVCLQHGFKTSDINNDENIKSPALLFRSLLLRLVTLALCDDNTYVRDGEVLLKVYNDFVNNVLCCINAFNSEKSVFSYFLTKEHLSWMNAIRQIVLAVKLIHSHQDNLTICLTTLKTLSYNIQRMISAYLVIANAQCEWPLRVKMTGIGKIKPSDLEDQFIEDKLNELEKNIGRKNHIKEVDDINEITKSIDITTYAAIEHLGQKQHDNAILDSIDIADAPQVAALIACKNNNCPAVIYQKLIALYELYFKSRCLLIALEQIDEIITACSWVPLVMGLIDLSQISQLIRIHADMCSELLAIPNNDAINQLPFKQIIMQKCFQAQAAITALQPRITALEELQNPIKMDKIKYHITHNISNLQTVQSALELSLLQYNEKRQAQPLIKPTRRPSRLIDDDAALPQFLTFQPMKSLKKGPTLFANNVTITEMPTVQEEVADLDGRSVLSMN